MRRRHLLGGGLEDGSEMFSHTKSSPTGPAEQDEGGSLGRQRQHTSHPAKTKCIKSSSSYQGTATKTNDEANTGLLEAVQGCLQDPAHVQPHP